MNFSKIQDAKHLLAFMGEELPLEDNERLLTDAVALICEVLAERLVELEKEIKRLNQ